MLYRAKIQWLLCSRPLCSRLPPHYNVPHLVPAVCYVGAARGPVDYAIIGVYGAICRAPLARCPMIPRFLLDSYRPQQSENPPLQQG